MDCLLSIEQSLDSLEEVLVPLLENDLSQTLSQLDLLQKAKLQVLLPYVVNDLVYIYLKTRGVNPKTHPVFEELDRVKQYFDKIKKAEDPEKRRFAVDQGAATRFIKHAIKESQAVQGQAQRDVLQATHTRFVDATVVRSRASAAAMAKIQARTTQISEEEGSSEEGDLEVFSGESTNVVADHPEGKGKQVMMLETSTSKKRQRGMDPWAGYDESETTLLSPNGEDSDEHLQKKAKAGQLTSPGMHDNTALVQEDIQVRDTAVVQGRKKRQRKEITDVDARSESSGAHSKANARQTSQPINADALHPSGLSTPMQGESKKKKKKRPKKKGSATLVD